MGQQLGLTLHMMNGLVGLPDLQTLSGLVQFLVAKDWSMGVFGGSSMTRPRSMIISSNGVIISALL